MIKFYTSPTLYTTQLNLKPDNKKPGFFYPFLSFFMKKNFSILLLTCLLFFGGNAFGQTPNGFLDFGTTASGTTATTGNTGFGGVRVSTGGGGFTIQNPGQSIGTAGEVRGIAPTGGSINSVGITSTEFGTAATTFTISFEVHFSGGSSGTWYFFAGNGATFGSTQSSIFTGNQVFTGMQFVYGASNTITTNNRAAGSWTAISGTPFAQNNAYFVTIIGNNSASTVNYGAASAYSVAANTYDLWVNGVLAGNDLGKAQLPAATAINAFRFYGESSTGNVAAIALDNVRWYNTCVLPPTHLVFSGVPATGSVSTDLSSFTATTRSGSTSGPVANSFTGAITVAKASGSGAISGTLAPSAAAGVATYSNVQFDAADTYTISATAASPIVSTTSGNIVISTANSITTSTISPTSYCAGDNVTVAYTSSGSFSGTFTAQLSNSSGSFASRTAIGTGASPITATIPTGTATGTGYRIRVVNNTPAVNGSDNSANITINNSTTTVAPTATQNISVSTNGTTLTVTEGSTPTSRKWRWSTTSGSGYADFTPAETATTYIPNFASANTYYVVCETTYPSPCGVVTTTSTEVQINVSANSITTGTITGSPFCSGAIGINVPFTYSAAASFPSGGSCTFTAQLSNSSGSFASPINLQDVVSDASGSQSISITIPGGTTTGTGYRIRVVSNSPLINGTDNGSNLSITSSVTPSVSIAITTGTNPTCAGSSVTFTATPTNGGGSPSYQWKLNGSNIATGVTYTSSTLANSDVVTCEMTSNATCPSPTTVTSNAITMTVNAVVTPSVSIAISTGATPTCTGSALAFTATPTNGGTPSYQWKLNGGNVGTNSATYSNSSIPNAAVITCEMTSTATCATPTLVTSNSISITNNTPTTPVFTTSSATVFRGQTGVVYTVTNVPGVTYNWSYTGSGAIITGTGNSVTVAFSTSATSGNISVTATNAGCTSTAATVAVTVASSATSNITNDATYGLTSNFDYKLWQGTSQTSASDGLGMFNIIIRDGGSSTPDADGLPTILNAITFNCPQFANIRSAALFTTTGTLVQSVTVSSSTISFSGFSVSNTTASDDGNTELILRVSFRNTPATITDNTKIVFTVSSATAASSATSSQFGTISATSDNDADNENRLEVTADRLAFVQQPSNASSGATMSPAVTVRGNDNNLIQDLDFSASITLTCSTPAALTSGGGPVSTSASVASFGSIVHSTNGTYTMTASATGFTSATSNTYVISTITLTIGDYRTNPALLGTDYVGFGSTGVVASGVRPWQRWNGGAWADVTGSSATSSPEFVTPVPENIFITRGNFVDVAGGRLYNNIYVELENDFDIFYSANSTVGLGIATGKVLEIRKGTFQLDGRIDLQGTAKVLIKTNATMDIYSTSSEFLRNSNSTWEVENDAFIFLNGYLANAWTGNEIFHEESYFEVLGWDVTTDPPLFTASSISPFTNAGYSALFGHLYLTFSSTTSLSSQWGGVFPNGNYNLTHGNFEVTNNDASDNINLYSGVTNSSITVGKDMIIKGTGNTQFQSSNSSCSLTVKRDLIKNGSGDFRFVSTGPSSLITNTLNIDSNLTINSGAFFVNNSSSVNIRTVVNLKGNLYKSSTSYLQNSNANGFTTESFNFTGNGNIQTVDVIPQSNDMLRFRFLVKDGAYVQIKNQDWALAQYDTLAVERGGTFDFGFNSAGTTALNVTMVAGTSSNQPAFKVREGGILKITSPDGIISNTTTYGINVGNVRSIPSTSSRRDYNQVATYWYIGKDNQTTGDGINQTGATTGFGKVVICDLLDNTKTLTPSVTFAISDNATFTGGGKLDIRRGQFIETESAYITGSTGTLHMAPGTLYKIVKGYSAPLSAGPEGTTPNNFIPRMVGTTYPYVLTGGTIELAGDATSSNGFQTLRGTDGTSRPKYNYVKFSGTNVYDNATKTATNYKNLSSASIIDSALIITENAIVNCIGNGGSTLSFSGNGGLVMNGTAPRLMIKGITTPEPQMDGINADYLLTTGTVEFYGSGATEQQQLRGNFNSPAEKINYYNIEINAAAANYSTISGAGNVDLNSSFTLSGTMNVNSPAVLRMDKDESIDGGGTFNINDGAGLLYGGSEGTPASLIEGLEADASAGVNSGNIRTTNRSFSSLASYGFVSSGNMPTGTGLPSTVKSLYLFKSNTTDRVTLTNSVRVDETLKMSRGNIITGSNRVELGKDVSNRGTLDYTAGYVVGNMRRW